MERRSECRSRSGRNLDALTEREKQVASLVATGLDNPAISARLGCSKDTVKRHLANILAKRGLHNRTEVAVWWHVRSKEGKLRKLQEEITAAEARLTDLQRAAR